MNRADKVHHEPLDLETKAVIEFGQPVTLYRSTCWCGWRGCWYAMPARAERSFERHMADVADADRVEAETRWAHRQVRV